jgi:hypothetical protein
MGGNRRRTASGLTRHHCCILVGALFRQDPREYLNERISVNSGRRVGMHVFVEVGAKLDRGCARTAQLDDSLAALSLAPSLRARQMANQGQPLQKVMAGCPVEPCIVFLSLRCISKLELIRRHKNG